MYLPAADYHVARISWSPEGTHLVHAEVLHINSRLRVIIYHVHPRLSIAGKFDLDLGPGQYLVSVFATTEANAVCILSDQQPQGPASDDPPCTKHAAFYNMQGDLTASFALPLASAWRFHAGRALFLALTDDASLLHVCSQTCGHRLVCLPVPPPESSLADVKVSPGGMWALVWRCGAESDYLIVSLGEAPAVMHCQPYDLRIPEEAAIMDVLMPADIALGRSSISLALPATADLKTFHLQLVDARPGSHGRLLCHPCGSTPMQASPSGHFFAVCSAARDAVHVLHGLSGEIMASVHIADMPCNVFPAARRVVGWLMSPFCLTQVEINDVTWHSDGQGLSCCCKGSMSSGSLHVSIGRAMYGTMRFYALDA